MIWGEILAGVVVSAILFVTINMDMLVPHLKKK